MSEILPCPFCGGKPKLFSTGDIVCEVCGLLATQETVPESIAYWNRRYPTAASTALDELAKHPEWKLMAKLDKTWAVWDLEKSRINPIASGPTPLAALQAAIERSGR